MKVIQKYVLGPGHHQVITAFRGARPLNAQIQHGLPCLWMFVDTDQRWSDYDVYLIPTDRGFPAGTPAYPQTYVGTLLLHNGEHAVHCFVEPHQPDEEGV